MRSLGLLTFMIPVGLSRAAAFFVGKFIGQGCEQSIRHYYNTCLQLSVIIGALQIVLLVIIDDAVIAFYTDIPEIQEQMHLAWGIFMVFVMFDTTQSIGGSAIRGSGQQKIGSIITGLAYWAIGIPLCLLLCFVYDWGIRGIWMGPTSAVIFNTTAYHIIFQRLDWKRVIIDAANIRRENMQRRASLKMSRDSLKELQMTAVADGDDDEFKKAKTNEVV